MNIIQKQSTENGACENAWTIIRQKHYHWTDWLQERKIFKMSRNLKDSTRRSGTNALIAAAASAMAVVMLSACLPTKKEDTFQPPPELGPKWGFIDHTGKFVLKPQFRRVLPFSEGLAAADISSRWGYIDNTGKFVIERQYEEVQSFAKGIAPVKLFGGKWQLIDKNGSPTSPAIFEALGECGEANKPLEPNTIIYCPFRSGNKWGFATSAGEIKIEPSYDSVGPFSEGLAAVSKLGKWGYVDATGKVVVDLKFDQAKPFRDRVAECQYGSDFVIVDTIGTMSISDPLNSRNFFHDGLGLSLKRGKYGFMNKSGKTVIKRRFTYAEDFSEGLALVGVANARLGYIDTKGQFAIPPVFDGATSFANKLAAVKIDPRLVADDGTISASAIEDAIKYDPHAGVAPKADPNAPAAGEEAKEGDDTKGAKDSKEAPKEAGDSKGDKEGSPKPAAEAGKDKAPAAPPESAKAKDKEAK